ncbi:hypothetical protein TIFTF001_021742 [Ficus carica]|uniref:GRAM domain-containing protein n=1 Tax=Ficus carica TaxID=3494 RepID=A0AA88AHB5_FICCA|nr:hypothetical protein TIFTF001_021742 [Ficus carica]
MTTLCEGHVIGIPIGSIAYPHNKRSPKALLTDHRFSDDGSSTLKRSKVDSVLNRMNELGRKADSFAHGIKENMRLGPKITETVKGKLSLGARILQAGRLDKIFKQLFSVTEGEKLLKASQCYLSTTAGSIAGLLFISSEKIAFCSQKSIKLSSPNVELI